MATKTTKQSKQPTNRMFELCKQNGIDINPDVCIFVLNEEQPINEYGLNIEQPLPVDMVESIVGKNNLVSVIVSELNRLFDEAVKTPKQDKPVYELGSDGKNHKTDKTESVDSSQVWEWRKAKQAIAKLLFPVAMKQAQNTYKEAHKKHERATVANLERRINEQNELIREERKQAQEDRAKFIELMTKLMNNGGKL